MEQVRPCCREVCDGFQKVPGDGRLPGSGLGYRDRLNAHSWPCATFVGPVLKQGLFRQFHRVLEQFPVGTRVAAQPVIKPKRHHSLRPPLALPNPTLVTGWRDDVYYPS